MLRNILLGVALAVAVLAIITAWIAQTRVEKQGRELRDQRAAISQLTQVARAQARFDKHIATLAWLTGHERSLASR